jgi:hypothetical protein
MNRHLTIDAGSRSASQITVFKDTWEWNEAEAMRAFRTLLGGSDMLACPSNGQRILRFGRVQMTSPVRVVELFLS